MDSVSRHSTTYNYYPKRLRSQETVVLIDNIREHCPNILCKNAVCPLPSVPQPIETTFHSLQLLKHNHCQKGDVGYVTRDNIIYILVITIS